MRRVYIAGPFRGVSAWLVECNVREAEALALRVAQLGAVPVCPHAMYRFYDRTLPDQFWLEATLDLLRVCHAIVLTKRWEESSGARAEEAEARRLGLPRFFEDADGLPRLAAWVREARGG
jgi:hypothetical protein